MAWQKSSRYNVRALVEAFFSRWKRVIGDALRFRTEDRRTTEIAIAVRILNHMLDLGRRPHRVIRTPGKGFRRLKSPRCNKVPLRHTRRQVRFQLRSALQCQPRLRNGYGGLTHIRSTPP